MTYKPVKHKGHPKVVGNYRTINDKTFPLLALTLCYWAADHCRLNTQCHTLLEVITVPATGVYAAVASTITLYLSVFWCDHFNQLANFNKSISLENWKPESHHPRSQNSALETAASSSWPRSSQVFELPNGGPWIVVASHANRHRMNAIHERNLTAWIPENISWCCRCDFLVTYGVILKFPLLKSKLVEVLPKCHLQWKWRSTHSRPKTRKQTIVLLRQKLWLKLPWMLR